MRQIVTAATTLIAEVGEDFTMDQLAERARVPRATLYRRVGSKIALLHLLASQHGVRISVQRDTRSRILVAACRVFARAGFVNATMEQIAEDAGVGVASVYRHFGDKEKLVWAAVEELSPRAGLRNLIAPSADVEADLLTLTGTLLPYLYEFRGILRIVFGGNEAEHAYIDRLRAGSDRTLDHLAAYFAAQINAGRIAATCTPRELALAYLGLIMAFTIIGPGSYGMNIDQPERINALIVRIFLNGAKPA